MWHETGHFQFRDDFTKRLLSQRGDGDLSSRGFSTRCGTKPGVSSAGTTRRKGQLVDHVLEAHHPVLAQQILHHLTKVNLED